MTKVQPDKLYRLGEIAMPHKRNNPHGLGLLPYSYRKMLRLAQSAFADKVVVEQSSELKGNRYFLYGKDVIAYSKLRIRHVR